MAANDHGTHTANCFVITGVIFTASQLISRYAHEEGATAGTAAMPISHAMSIVRFGIVLPTSSHSIRMQTQRYRYDLIVIESPVGSYRIYEKRLISSGSLHTHCSDSDLK